MGRKQNSMEVLDYPRPKTIIDNIQRVQNSISFDKSNGLYAPGSYSAGT